MRRCGNGNGDGPSERQEREERRRRRAQELGRRVRGLRGFRRYTQARLSQLTGLSRNYLSELELGRRPRPRPDTLVRLAAALGVTVAQLQGKQALPEELGAGQPEGEPEPGPGGEPPAPAAPSPPASPTAPEEEALRGAFAFAGVLPESLETVRQLYALLRATPPGVIVSYQQFPDGSVLVLIRLPARARALDDGGNGDGAPRVGASG